MHSNALQLGPKNKQSELPASLRFEWYVSVNSQVRNSQVSGPVCKAVAVVLITDDAFRSAADGSLQV